MPITQFTNIPGRGQDPSTFAARADNFLGTQLPRFVSETNAAAAEIDANATLAEDSALVAAGSANFAGAWASLSGPLTVPAAVSHNGEVWILVQDIANVATVQPGTNAAYWVAAFGAYVRQDGGTITGSLDITADLTVGDDLTVADLLTSTTQIAVKRVTETVATLATSLTPANGTVQTKTLSGNLTITEGAWANGEAVVVTFTNANSYTITHPAAWKKSGGFPTALQPVQEIVYRKIGGVVRYSPGAGWAS